ncbi:hypothetical protein D0C36_15900 [Mucilaginibacter conchicola]|uniref:Thioredoxin domain-containing protein n=1 Tax=Mucilaginibacter conchicola TaxID=2303333 RepID=A0A372NUC3_9SPHI|nr:thioredoxin domain-containing protein [Mucilaginibacter conchicola]RFZ92873.1 hypothetical protein D0C36_15900 [Mucilaginibacter conchicola]
MKLKMGFLLFLCLNFRVWGQEKGVLNKDVLSKDGQAVLAGQAGRSGLVKGKPITGAVPRIGEPVPDVLVTGIRGLQLGGKVIGGTLGDFSGGASGSGGSLRLSAFRGKLLIIDFWATWCSPCRAMVPVLDSLQKVFGDKVVFLPVTYQSAAEAGPVLASLRRLRPFDLPEVLGDKVLHGLFPHRSLPHFVWIDGSGILRAITEEKEVTGENIRRLLAEGSVVRDGVVGLGRTEGSVPVAASGVGAGLALKRDSSVAYDAGKALLLDGNGGDGSRVLYHSLLSGYKAGLASGISVSAFDPVLGQRFTARNVPFPWLCRLAFGENGRRFPVSRTMILSRDALGMNSSLSGQAFEGWLDAGHGWCYELALPASLAGSAYGMMQADLLRLFPQYRVSVERRELPCLALVRTGDADRLRSAGGEVSVDIGPYKAVLHNAHLSQLMMRLERQYLQGSALPLTDATGYTGRVDLSLEAPLYDVPALNKALAAYGLALREQRGTVEVLVVRDAQ